jgi:hypothetical protein
MVDFSAYTGAAGDEIRIIASDDFMVKSVYVQINDADGAPIEEGEAVNKAGSLWIYTATQNNNSLTGNKIVISASDLPGNITTEEKSL